MIRFTNVIADWNLGENPGDEVDWVDLLAGQLINQKMGEKFGLTYSAVSRKVSIFKDLHALVLPTAAMEIEIL